MKVTELRTKEPLPIIHGRSANSFVETKNGQAGGDWRMTATNWGVKIEKTINFRGELVRIERVVPWGMIKFADVQSDPNKDPMKPGVGPVKDLVKESARTGDANPVRENKEAENNEPILPQPQGLTAERVANPNDDKIGKDPHEKDRHNKGEFHTNREPPGKEPPSKEQQDKERADRERHERDRHEKDRK